MAKRNVEYASLDIKRPGKKPGFLIGGVPENFGVSARLGEGDFFVIEADEYDTAFFNERFKIYSLSPRDTDTQ